MTKQKPARVDGAMTRVSIILSAVRNQVVYWVWLTSELMVSSHESGISQVDRFDRLIKVFMSLFGILSTFPASLSADFIL